MKLWKQSSGNQSSTGLAVPTTREMEKTGAREGRDSFRRFSLFSRGQQDPFPAYNDPHIPGAVRKAEGACRNEAAQLAATCAAHSTSIAQEIAADEAVVETLGTAHLPAPERVLAGWINFTVLILIGAAEWVVNALAFAIFGGTNLQTYVVALVVAVLLPICAAVVGSAWKQHRHDSLAMLSLIASVSLIVAVALIRQSYFYDVVNGILGLNIAPWLLTIIYVVINMAMFFCGVLVSYLHSESNPEGQDARRRLEAAQQRLTTNQASQDGLKARYRALTEDLTPQLQTLAWAYNNGNMRARQRARRPEHRIQPIWVDAIEGLEVPVPDALLDEPAPRSERTASAASSPTAAAATHASPLSRDGSNGNGHSADGDLGAADPRRATKRRQSGITSSTSGTRVFFTTYSGKEPRK